MSIVHFSEHEDEDMKDDDGDHSDVSVGILTNFKVVREEENEEILLFISLFVSSKSKPARTTAWVKLGETKVTADLSLGFVSQKWLERFQIHDTSDA